MFNDMSVTNCLNTLKASIVNQGIEHFKSSVPDEVALKLQAIAYLAKDNFISDQAEPYGCNMLEGISGVGYDGFIPFQDGGFEVTEMYPCDQDYSYHLTEAQTQWVDKHTIELYKGFKHDYKSELEAAGITLPDNYGYDDLPEDLQDKFSDYESDWFEPALLRLEIWCNADNEAHWGNEANSIMLRLSLGYSDAPYYRSRYDETIKELTFSFTDFMKADNKDLLKQLFTAI